MEKWNTVDGFNGRYLVSNNGKFGRLTSRGITIMKPPNDKCLNMYIDLQYKGQRFRLRLSELVAKSFVDNPKGYNKIIHLDGNPKNCKADNLKWISEAELYFYKNGLTLDNFLKEINSGDTLCNIAKRLNLPYSKFKLLMKQLNLIHPHELVKELNTADGELIEEVDECIRVSNFGYLINKNNKKYLANQRTDNVYLKCRGIAKTYSIGLEVALAFIPNPNGFNYVEHIDGDPSNNHLNNLRWVPFKKTSKRGQNSTSMFAICMSIAKGGTLDEVADNDEKYKNLILNRMQKANIDITKLVDNEDLIPYLINTLSRGNITIGKDEKCKLIDDKWRYIVTNKGRVFTTLKYSGSTVDNVSVMSRTKTPAVILSENNVLSYHRIDKLVSKHFERELLTT